jgi:hypothetical protein
MSARSLTTFVFVGLLAAAPGRLAAQDESRSPGREQQQPADRTLQSAPETQPAARCRAPFDWDALSATVVPRLLAKTGDAYLLSILDRASCTIEVQASSSIAPAVEGVVQYAWHDADGDGVLDSGEVDVQTNGGTAQGMEAQLGQFRRQFEMQALGNTCNLLLLNRVRTTQTDDGYEIALTPGAEESVFHSLGIAEMRLMVSKDWRITEIRVRDTQGVQGTAQPQNRDLGGRWFSTGYTRRTTLPDGGMLLENGASSQVMVDGLPLTASVSIQTTAMTAAGETVASMNQNLTFKDWRLGRRSQPLAWPQVCQEGHGAPVETIARRAPVKQETALPPMEKYVSQEAVFVLYKPKGWTVTEGAQPGFRTLSITDPQGLYEVAMFHGKNPVGDDVPGLAALFMRGIGQQFPDFALKGAMISPDRSRIVFDAAFTVPNKGKRDFRCWVSGSQGQFLYSSIEAPAGELEAKRQLLLTILSNVRVIKGAFDTGGVVPIEVQLAPYRLSDGSASFLIPQGWSCTELGKGGFIATDPTQAFSFIVANVEVISPDLNVSVPGVPVSRYLKPSRALEFLVTSQGLASNMEFEDITPRADIANAMAQVYTAGPVEVEELVYTCDTRTGRTKGYTFGCSFGSRLGTNWSFWHLTVAGPLDQFDAFLGNFVSMLQSYQIDLGWARNYVQQGMIRLRRMQQETAAMVARNAQEIHQMMQAAYDERQRSMDYIDYQRTNYIRGEQDWISSMEGGAVYHTDTWGTKNTATGEYWEGAPYNYVHFEGENPKYNEQMTAINNRQLYDQVFGGGG